jgi:CHAD domain-containing protein
VTDGIDVPELDANSRIGDVVRAALAVSVETLVREDAALRLEVDEEAVHRARVSVRRLRSDLRTFSPLLDETWAGGLRERSRWLQDGFSAARDADVLLVRLRRQSAELPDADGRGLEQTLAPLRAAREAAYQRLRSMLREPRYPALLQELVEAAKRPPFNANADAAARSVIPEIVAGAWSTLRKRVRKRTRPPTDRELHRIRIAAKRVRYAVDAVAPVAGRSAVRLARAVERMQTILGDQHDAVGACERLRTLTVDGSAFVAGELAALEYRCALEGRRAWRDAWRDAKRARRRFGR